MMSRHQLATAMYRERLAEAAQRPPATRPYEQAGPPADERRAVQFLVIRRDLGLRRGKEIAQACHGSVAFLTRRMGTAKWFPRWPRRTVVYLTEAELHWIEHGQAKIVCHVPDGSALLALYQQALRAGLKAELIRDAGRTEIPAGTVTVLAIGPDWKDRLDPVTRHLPLY